MTLTHKFFHYFLFIFKVLNDAFVFISMDFAIFVRTVLIYFHVRKFRKAKKLCFYYSKNIYFF